LKTGKGRRELGEEEGGKGGGGERNPTYRSLYSWKLEEERDHTQPKKKSV
jgi:hypothetical protein